jgi:tRNA dimethylallyltransferase
MKRPLVIVLLGPTAVGKTEVSLDLAELIGAEIISIDSRLFYRGMDIGTAKPDLETRQRIPHHLIDVSDPDDTWSLERFIEAAMQVIQGVHQRERLSLLVGGTGQYIRGLIDGWRPPPRPEDDGMRERLFAIAKQDGPRELHNQLRTVDPLSADRIDYRNIRRVVRALEVYQLTGEPFSRQRGIQPPDFDSTKIGLTRPRNELYERIDQRIETMLEAGWIKEVENLMAAGYSLEHPALSAIGYQQLVEHLNGELALEDAVAIIKRLTRKYVRRQANWFKSSDTSIRWFNVGADVVDQIVHYLKHQFDLPVQSGK